MLDYEPFLIFAQEGAPGVPGTTPVPTTTTTTSDGNTPVPPGGPPGGMNSLFLPIVMGGFILLMILMSLGPRREKKRREAMLKAIKKHDRVQTIGGVIGAIVELKPESVVLKVDEQANTRITFARSAIQQVLTNPGEVAATPDR